MKRGVLLTFSLCILPFGPGTTHEAPGPLRGAGVAAQAPTPSMVDSPAVKVLTGLYAQQFQEEMNFIVQALGVTCNTCHAPRGNFASDEKPLKLKARQMLEMTRAINTQFFPDHKPAEGESVLGKVTCYTCHKGEQVPKTSVGH